MRSALSRKHRLFFVFSLYAGVILLKVTGLDARLIGWDIEWTSVLAGLIGGAAVYLGYKHHEKHSRE